VKNNANDSHYFNWIANLDNNVLTKSMWEKFKKLLKWMILYNFTLVGQKCECSSFWPENSKCQNQSKVNLIKCLQSLFLSLRVRKERWRKIVSQLRVCSLENKFPLLIIKINSSNITYTSSLYLLVINSITKTNISKIHILIKTSYNV
jgi:hypothetical protein